MRRSRVCIMRVGGTNCDQETKRAFDASGMTAEILHFHQLIKLGNLLDYDMLVIPGGFSHGDYVRAGAIWAKQLMAKLGQELKTFVDEERPILGICNGFQILVEAGLLPRFKGISELPEAALAPNVPQGYNCRWIYLRHENRGNCIFTRKIPPSSVIKIPIANSEGRFIFEKSKEEEYLSKLLDNDQLVFTYCNSYGERTKEGYLSNPNNSFHDIAGICDPTGTTLGLMPHPERAYFGWQLADWTRRRQLPLYGDGKLIFDSVAEYFRRTA